MLHFADISHRRFDRRPAFPDRFLRLSSLHPAAFSNRYPAPFPHSLWQAWQARYLSHKSSGYRFQICPRPLSLGRPPCSCRYPAAGSLGYSRFPWPALTAGRCSWGQWIHSPARPPAQYVTERPGCGPSYRSAAVSRAARRPLPAGTGWRFLLWRAEYPWCLPELPGPPPAA